MNIKYEHENIFSILSQYPDTAIEIIEYFLNSIDKGLAIIDDKNIIIKHNDSFREIFNSKTSLLGLSLQKIIPNYEQNSSQNFYFVEDLKKNLKIDSKTICVEDSSFTIVKVSNYYPDSNIIEKDSEVKFYKEMYENIINSIDEGIHAIDTSGKLFVYNSSIEKLEGYKASEIIGKHVTEVYNLDWKTSLLLKVLKEGNPIFDFHQSYTTTNGKWVDVMTSIVPLYSKDKIIGAAAILKDFTNFKKMAEQVLDLQEQLHNKKLNTNNQTSGKKHDTKYEILGKNKQFIESINWAKAAAATESPVLIYGETGTGKELFAQSIHSKGIRSKGPFLAINCAAIPENLLEGILFGTTKGAFTGAIDRAGLLEQANSGTLFLDEVNSMPLALQAKLLRVLENKKIRRLGAKEEISIDTRIISSCNLEPTTAIEKQMLRADLFYRLAVVYIDIPPLRQRTDDIELLSNHFIDYYNKYLKKNIQCLSKEILLAFKKFHWPGNIRQLKHTIECAMNIVTANEPYIEKCHIPKYLNIFPKLNTSISNTINNHSNASFENIHLFDQIKIEERNRIIDIIKKNKGNISKSAAELGMSRQSLQYRIKKYKLK